MKLSTSAFQEMRKAGTTGTPTGRADALRRAMLTLIDTGSEDGAALVPVLNVTISRTES